MPSKYGNKQFYNSKRWISVSQAYMQSKNYICERCGRPATICHHKIYLDADNVHDPTIALNPSNLEALCTECHNAEHGRKHNYAIFDDKGEVVKVKEAYALQDWEAARDQIDDVIARAQSSLCGIMLSQDDEEALKYEKEK